MVDRTWWTKQWWTERGGPNSGGLSKAKIVAFFNRPGLLKEKFSSAEIDACISKMEDENHLMESGGVVFFI